MIDNLPHPSIVDRGQSIECVSLFVPNSNYIWWIDHPILVKGIDYKVEVVQNETHNREDGYHRLRLLFLNSKVDIFERFNQTIDDTNRSTLYHYSTFECGARFDTEILLHKSIVKVDFEGKIAFQ